MESDDAALTSRVQAALLRVPSLRHADITIESSRGVVRMSGTSVSSVDRLTAVETARKVYGVVSIHNEMSLQD
jgi:osmotically-inducible protein OsmY